MYASSCVRYRILYTLMFISLTYICMYIEKNEHFLSGLGLAPPPPKANILYFCVKTSLVSNTNNPEIWACLPGLKNERVYCLS